MEKQFSEVVDLMTEIVDNHMRGLGEGGDRIHVVGKTSWIHQHFLSFLSTQGKRRTWHGVDIAFKKGAASALAPAVELPFWHFRFLQSSQNPTHEEIVFDGVALAGTVKMESIFPGIPTLKCGFRDTRTGVFP